MSKAMSKTKTDKIADENIVATEPQQQPSVVDELKKKGHTILSAATREELAEMLDNIPADCSYTAGAIGQCFANGTWTIRIDLKP